MGDENGQDGQDVMDNTAIVKLDLQGMGLQGSIPSQLATTLLPNLYFLNIGNNPGITGQLPNLGPNLKFLRVHNAALNGDLSLIGGMTGLLMLDLSNNQITGSIPASVSQLSNLKVLDLSFNRLSGSIPNEISFIYPLLSLCLASNPLTGTLPTSGFAIIQKLDVSNTYLTGNLPAFANGRTIPLLDVSSTNLNGQIPASLLQSASPSPGSCPFTNSRLTLPPNTAAPLACPPSLMTFSGQNGPIFIPGQPGAAPASSPLAVGLMLGIVGAVAVVLVLIGLGVIYLKKRSRALRAAKIESVVSKPGMRPASAATFDTVGSSLYEEEDDNDDAIEVVVQEPSRSRAVVEEGVNRDSMRVDTTETTIRPPPATVAATRTSVRWSLAESV